MTRSQRLRPIASMKQKEQLNSARILSEGFNELKMREERLIELTHYRDDYLNKFQQLTQVSASIERVRHYKEFIARLNQSIVLQNQRVVDAKRKIELKKVHWQQARARSDAFDKVVDRYRDEENQLNEKRNQKETDDHAQRVGGRGIASHR